MTKDLLAEIYKVEAPRKKIKEDEAISYCQFVYSSSIFIITNTLGRIHLVTRFNCLELYIVKKWFGPSYIYINKKQKKCSDMFETAANM